MCGVGWYLFGLCMGGQVFVRLWADACVCVGVWCWVAGGAGGGARVCMGVGCVWCVVCGGCAWARAWVCVCGRG